MSNRLIDWENKHRSVKTRKQIHNNKIEIDRINSMIQKEFLYFIIEQNDISARQNKMIIENVDENSDDEHYVDSIKHYEKKSQNQLNQFRQSIQNRINHYISVYTASISFYVDY